MLPRTMPVFLTIAMLGCLLSHRSCGQSIPNALSNADLDAKVHLRLGKTTLAKTTASLSQQTGLTIVPAAYLGDHKLIVEMDNLSTRAVLDSLTQLNSWYWRRDEKGVIWIDKPEPKRSQSVAEVAKSLQLTLPRDVQVYMALASPKQVGNEKEARFDRKGLYQAFVARPKTLAKIDNISRKKATELLKELSDSAVKTNSFAYKNLTRQQQHTLLALLFLRMVRRICDRPPDYESLSGKLNGYQSDVTKTAIDIKDGGLNISYTDANHIRRGFGIALPRK